VDTKRTRELKLMLESAARSVMGANALAPCDELTKQRIRETMESVINSTCPEIEVRVVDRTPKTVEEKVALTLMDEDYENVMHVEILIQPLPVEYITMTLNLPSVEASADVGEVT